MNQHLLIVNRHLSNPAKGASHKRSFALLGTSELISVLRSRSSLDCKRELKLEVAVFETLFALITFEFANELTMPVVSLAG
jgi:hypothetical protein